MADHTQPDLPAANKILRRLNEVFYEHWDFGSNALVGWMPTKKGISVLIAPVLGVFPAASTHKRIFYGDRKLDAATFADIARELDVKPKEIRFGEPGDPWGILNHSDVSGLFARYAITKTGQRAAFLFDIAGFALRSPEEQAAQLSVLGYSLNVAAEKAFEQGIEIDLARSNTGDGFYVWNRNSGYTADVNLFCVLMFALALQALQHRRVSRPYVPTIRTCFGVGSHYSFFQLNRLDPIGTDYIVGDLTIDLARLIEHTAPNQILVAEFHRSNELSEMEVGTEGFLASAAEILDGLKDIEMSGSAVTRIATYLTGEQKADGTYGVRRLMVQDKHGLSRSAHNAKVNIFLRDGEPIFLGLQDSEVEEQKR